MRLVGRPLWLVQRQTGRRVNDKKNSENGLQGGPPTGHNGSLEACERCCCCFVLFWLFVERLVASCVSFLPFGGGRRERPEEWRRLRFGRSMPPDWDGSVPMSCRFSGAAPISSIAVPERDERRLTTEKDETTDGDGPPLSKTKRRWSQRIARTRRGTSGQGTAGVRS